MKNKFKYRCPHCAGRVFFGKKTVPGYFAHCKACQEDFFFFEVAISKPHRVKNNWKTESVPKLSDYGQEVLNDYMNEERAHTENINQLRKFFPEIYYNTTVLVYYYFNKLDVAKNFIEDCKKKNLSVKDTLDNLIECDRFEFEQRIKSKPSLTSLLRDKQENDMIKSIAESFGLSFEDVRKIHRFVYEEEKIKLIAKMVRQSNIPVDTILTGIRGGGDLGPAFDSDGDFKIVNKGFKVLPWQKS